MKRSEIQAIFFDFDGVILDSTRIKTETFKALYKPYGEDIVDLVVGHHIQHGGISRVEKIKYCHKTFLDISLEQEELKSLSDQFSSMVKDRVVNADWIPGARKFIEENYQSNNLYIISGTPQEELLQIVKRRGIDGYFKEVLGSPTKKPDHVRRILHQQDYNPDFCVFIGDARTDLNTALETGTHFIGIQGEIDFPKETIVLPDCRGLELALKEMF